MLTEISYFKKYFLIYIFHFLLSQIWTPCLPLTVKSHLYLLSPDNMLCTVLVTEGKEEAQGP